jgi:nickel superoxide dismutase
VVNGLALILGTIWLFAPVLVAAHCQVPCGIYNDEARVERLREDAQTIAKAIEQMTELAGKTDVQCLNQMTRWVMNKEQHGSHVIEVIANYFLAQRVKPSDDVDA